MDLPKNSIISIASFKESQYDVLRQVSIDKENLSPTYKENFEGGNKKQYEMEAKGFIVIRIEVDVYELIDWCASHDIPVKTETRTRFVMEKLKEIVYGK